MKIFGVDVTFRAAGDMFTHGLTHAAGELGVEYKSALWDAPNLPAQVAQFKPDLILVIHGRDFVDRWKDQWRAVERFQTAVWLVDEPYEVDNSEGYSSRFNWVFVQDKNTIDRHVNAHYLPTCFDPSRHFDVGKERIHKVGFIGQHYKSRRKYLEALARAGHLSYIIGGAPFSQGVLKQFYKEAHVPPSRTAEIYQQTQIVLNVWREIHHWNKHKVPAYSLSPRVYEALACGALVISEPRPELEELFPELPTFDTPASAVKQADYWLSETNIRADLMMNISAKLKGHTYADRLKTIIEVCGLGEARGGERRQWEHHCTRISEGLAEQYTLLNVCGRDGWELVGVSDGMAYFKREKI